MDNDGEQYAVLEWDYDTEKRKIFIDNLAPIVLFTYNRLDHTKQTVEALKKNIYAEDSKLFIYSDAPKTEVVKEEVDHVRAYLHTIEGFKSITIVERKENWGLARNIIDGVTRIVNEYGKIIVLEDDIVTSKCFLKYMNDGLEVYKNEEKVMAISSYFWTDNTEKLPETFFLQPFACWGWSTWKQDWDYFERDPEKLTREFSDKEIYQFDIDGSGDFWSQVIDNKEGKLYTWAIFFFAAIFRQDGLVAYAKYNLSKNIGIDGTGENCDVCTAYNTNVFENEIQRFSMQIQENLLARKNAKEFFNSLKPSFYERIYNKCKNIIKICKKEIKE